MICQFCEIEYPTGTERCAECRSDLVEALPDASSEVVIEPLGDLYDHRQLEHLEQLLVEASIPYEVHSGTALGMRDRQALTNEVHSSQWEARVLVVSSRLEEARLAWQAATEAGAEAAVEDRDDDEDDRFARNIRR